jgi:hypothetical protein
MTELEDVKVDRNRSMLVITVMSDGDGDGDVDVIHYGALLCQPMIR